MKNVCDLSDENLAKSSFWFVFQDKKILLLNKKGRLQVPLLQDIDDLRGSISVFHEIGFLNGLCCFCAEINQEIDLSNKLEFIPIKRALDALDHDFYSLVVKSIQIIDWDNNHRYCGLCGNKTTRLPALFEAHCVPCRMIFYPRISPSIIVLIKNKNQILMARGEHFAEGVYGLIAGFVSPGETLEDAVNREVMEEVGIKVKNVRYFGSQAWPFPDSIMMAFEADYDSGEIVIDDVEIKEAGWYEVGNLPGMPSSTKSIASVLIDDFINRNLKC